MNIVYEDTIFFTMVTLQLYSRCKECCYIDILDGDVRVYADGKIYNLQKGRVLVPWKGSKGALTVKLPKNGDTPSKIAMVKKLVYEAFVGPTNTNLLHVDGDEMNCSLANIIEKTCLPRTTLATRSGHYKVIEDGRYRIYEDGSVYCIETSRFLQPYVANGVLLLKLKNGTNLIGDKGRKICFVKKLVYEAFIGPAPHKIMHLDGNQLNCCKDNLAPHGSNNAAIVEQNKHKYPSPEFAFAPAPYSRYAASRSGKIIDMVSGNIHKGTLTRQGYVSLLLIADDDTSKKLPAHRMVVWCFFPSFDFWNKKCIVNHKDNVKINNALANLEIATHQSNLAHARLCDPTIAQRGGDTRRKEIEMIPQGGGLIRTFESMKHAYAQLKTYQSTLSNHIRKRTVFANSTFRFKFAEVADELWYKIRNVNLPDWVAQGLCGLDGLYVSSTGRIMSPDGVMYKSVRGSNGNQPFLYRRAMHQFHSCLCFAWNGIPPSDDHSADHRNRDHTDDRPQNMEWSTREEQNSNRRSSTVVVRTCVKTGAIQEFATAVRARKATGVTEAIINSRAASGKEHAGATWEVRKPAPVIIPETPGPAHPSVTDPVPYERVREICWRGGDTYVS